MNNIAVITDDNIANAFRIFGIETVVPADFTDAGDILKKLVNQHRPIIFITERWAKGIINQIDILRSMSLSAISIIPDNKTPLGLGDSIIRAACEKAIGKSDLA